MKLAPTMANSTAAAPRASIAASHRFTRSSSLTGYPSGRLARIVAPPNAADRDAKPRHLRKGYGMLRARRATARPPIMPSLTIVGEDSPNRSAGDRHDRLVLPAFP